MDPEPTQNNSPEVRHIPFATTAVDLARAHPCRCRPFRVFDITKDEFDPADVWLCKDCIQHLSNRDIMLALRNFCNSSVEFALISNHTDVKENTDIPTGDFRHVDLTLPPFNLPEPLLKLPDSPIDREPRYIGVWRRGDLIGRLES